MSSTRISRSPSSAQMPFAIVTPIISTALIMGAAGGFAIATILTLTSSLHVRLGIWWLALVQAHGHLQLFGWAGLFILGVALHFLPRLRGNGLRHSELVPYAVWAFGIAFTLRLIAQPMAALSQSPLWTVLMATSGLSEVFAAGLIFVCIAATFLNGPPLQERKAFQTVSIMLGGIGASFIIAILSNASGLINAAMHQTSIVAASSDYLTTTAGLFGMLVPMALAMSAQSLPMYAGLQAFPHTMMIGLSITYQTGVLLALIGFNSLILQGVGFTLIAIAILIFVVEFMRMMRTRGKIPAHISKLSSNPVTLVNDYRKNIAAQTNNYGPFVPLVASAYTWAILGAIILLQYGIATIFNAAPLIAFDAARHSLTAGFIALLIGGIAPRMLPGFSGGKIASPNFVTATLWLGNIAVAFRVLSVVIAPFVNGDTATITTFLFGLSGPFGLAYAWCLLLNLWPAIHPRITILRK